MYPAHRLPLSRSGLQNATGSFLSIADIVKFPPGGSVDVVARTAASQLAESLGQQVVIGNRSGSSGNIGAEVAARAAPDTKWTNGAA